MAEENNHKKEVPHVVEHLDDAIMLLEGGADTSDVALKCLNKKCGALMLLSGFEYSRDEIIEIYRRNEEFELQCPHKSCRYFNEYWVGGSEALPSRETNRWTETFY